MHMRSTGQTKKHSDRNYTVHRYRADSKDETRATRHAAFDRNMTAQYGSECNLE